MNFEQEKDLVASCPVFPVVLARCYAFLFVDLSLFIPEQKIIGMLDKLSGILTKDIFASPGKKPKDPFPAQAAFRDVLMNDPAFVAFIARYSKETVQRFGRAIPYSPDLIRVLNSFGSPSS